MPPRTKEKRLEIEGRWFKIIETYAADPRSGVGLALELLGQCPEGYHPWTIRVQKSSKGRRASVEIYFRENRRAPSNGGEP